MGWVISLCEYKNMQNVSIHSFDLLLFYEKKNDLNNVLIKAETELHLISPTPTLRHAWMVL